MAPRWLSALVGVWLATTAWLVPEPQAARWIQFLAGGVIFLVAMLAMGLGRARRFNTFLGFLVALVPFLLGMHQLGSGVNLLGSGLVTVGASLVPPSSR